ncbi:MAG: NAD(P)/FAD-dependent oxidoreductase [Clostridiales bacterium]|nr:NAD(P)/FAD-dependent oxidoreductase [Clostridiales bacterium]
MNSVAVIGGGPAGMMAAGQAALRGLDVTLLERNERCGRKLLITGKGRCNLTNEKDDVRELVEQVPVNGRFLYSAFSAFSPRDTVEFFEGLGVRTKVERGGRVFPVSDKAMDVVDAMAAFVRRSGARTLQGRAESLRIEHGTVAGVCLEDGGCIPCDAAIIATGGLSYPRTGSTGDGYRLARQARHTIIAPKPSLVPMEVHEGWCSELQGLSLRNVSIRMIDEKDGKAVYEDFGELVFTHYGLSGPVILSASSHIRDLHHRRVRLEIDLKPALTPEQLDKRLQRELAAQANRDFINALGALLPRKLVPVMVRLSGIAPATKCNQVTREMRTRLLSLLKCLPLTLTAFRPIEEAVITSGGVNVKEIRPGTMASKLAEHLYFAGEVIDVDAYTGGYNLQIAFSTGYLAGIHILEDKI